jgi:hypothetical protein
MAMQAPMNNALMKYYGSVTPSAPATMGGGFGSSTGFYLPGVPRN